MSDLSNERLEESRRIRAEGARLRGEAISLQIEAGFTLCSAATQSIRSGDSVNAKRTLDKISHAIQKIRKHLDQPEHVPVGILPTLRDELERLEKELKTIQEELRL